MGDVLYASPALGCKLTRSTIWTFAYSYWRHGSAVLRDHIIELYIYITTIEVTLIGKVIVLPHCHTLSLRANYLQAVVCRNY